MLAALLILHAQAPIDFAAAWEEVAGTIRQSYYARASRKVEMERRLSAYAPRAKAAKTEAEFDSLMDAMVAEFGDSHFGFFTRAEASFFLMDALVRGSDGAKFPQFGAWFRSGPEGETVQMVLDGSSAAKAGLRKGDVVMKADDVPFQPLLSLQGKTSTELTFRRGGQELTTPVSITESNGTEWFLRATDASVRLVPFEGRRIGYIHLWTLANRSFVKALRTALRGPLSQADALVLDLRDGFGGNPEGYTALLKEFHAPTVVLINEGSRSAKELLAWRIRKERLGKLIGLRTAGNVLGTYPRPIGKWAYLEVPMVEVPADGVRLEKRGVDPDIVVQPEFDSEGHDLVLARALELLRSVPIRV